MPGTDPELYYASGVCGPSADPTLPRFATDMAYGQGAVQRIEATFIYGIPSLCRTRALDSWKIDCTPGIDALPNSIKAGVNRDKFREVLQRAR